MDKNTEQQQIEKRVQWALAIAFVALLVALYSISVSGAKAQVINSSDLLYSKHIKDGFVEGRFPDTASNGMGIKVFPKGYETDYVRFIWNNLVWSDDAGTQQGNIISSIQANPVQVSGDTVFYNAYVNNSKLIKATYINSPSQLKYELELKNLSAPNNAAWRVKEYLTIDDVPASAIIELDDGSAWDKTNQKQSNLFKIKFVDGQKLIIPQPYVYDGSSPSNKAYGYYIMSKAGGKLRGSMISPPYSSWSSYANPVFEPTISGGAVGSIVTIGSNQINSTNLSLGQNVNASLIKSWTVNITSSSNRNLSSTRCGTNISGLVGCWYMDETTGIMIQDFSVYGNNGTWNGNTSINSTIGKYNTAINYDGANDFINISASSLLNFGTNDFTISTIVSTDIVSGYHIFLGKDVSGSRDWVFSFGGSTASQFEFQSTTDTTTYVVSSTVILANKLYFVTVTRKGTTTSLYINGVNESSDLSSGTNYASNTPINFGRRAYVGFNQYWDGWIDEVQIYNRSMSDAEIWNNYILKTQQLQVKSITNNTWSGVWNSSANNPLPVPYASGELESILQFFLDDNQTVDGVLCYNCSKQINFSVVSTIQIGEDYTEISQSHANGYQWYNMSYIPSQNYNYSILSLNLTNYSDTYRGSATLENTTSRTLSGSYPNYTINFTAPINGTLSYHNISLKYNNAPTGSISNQSYEAGNSMIVTCTANDPESNLLNISMTVNNTLKQGSSCSFDYTGLAVGNYSSQVNITDLNGTIGTPPSPYVNISFWVNVSADVTAPATPVISNGTPAQTTLVLSATNESEYVNYTWWWKENTTSIWLNWTKTTTNTTTVTGITSCSQNDYKVQVYDASGNHANSSQITVQQACENAEYAAIVTKLNTVINNQAEIQAEQAIQSTSLNNADMGAVGIVGGLLGGVLVIGYLNRNKHR